MDAKSPTIPTCNENSYNNKQHQGQIPRFIIIFKKQLNNYIIFVLLIIVIGFILVFNANSLFHFKIFNGTFNQVINNIIIVIVPLFP